MALIFDARHSDRCRVEAVAVVQIDQPRRGGCIECRLINKNAVGQSISVQVKQTSKWQLPNGIRKKGDAAIVRVPIICLGDNPRPFVKSAGNTGGAIRGLEGVAVVE